MVQERETDVFPRFGDDIVSSVRSLIGCRHDCIKHHKDGIKTRLRRLVMALQSEMIHLYCFNTEPKCAKFVVLWDPVQDSLGKTFFVVSTFH